MSCLHQAVLLSVALALPAGTARAGVSPALATCNAGFAAAPNTEGAAACFFDAGAKEPALAAATTARMEDLLAAHPGLPWLALYLGHAKAREPQSERAVALYRTAAAAFAAQGQARGEVLARGNLQSLLISQGKSDEAKQEAERAERVAVASRDPELIARAKIILARYLFRTGQDLERAYVLLREAQSVAFPGGQYFLRRDCLYWRGNVCLGIGRYPEARRSFEHAAALARAQGDAYGEASALYGIARAYFSSVAQAPRAGWKPMALALARAALAAAKTGSNREVEAKAHWLLGMLAAGAEARGHLDQCLQAASGRNRGYCLDALARQSATVDTPRARAAVREALALAQQADDPWSMAFAWRERMRVGWATLEPDQPPSAQVVADSSAALDAIEALRDQQAQTAGQAELFSSWTEDYAWLIGRLLEASGGGSRGVDGVAAAFGVMERARARALLDALAAAHATPPASAATRELQAGSAALLAEIAGVQRRLLDPDLPAADRGPARAVLERLELAEADLRHQLARANLALSGLRDPAVTDLAQVQQALAPDEAFLSFQIAPDEGLYGGSGGGSWVIAATHGGARAYRLRRDQSALRSAVELFNGLFERRDGAETGSAAGLYQALLADALSGLPAGIERLVILPDDVLHQLPFAALRPTAVGAPLIDRYRMTVVPSATLWLRWRARRPPPAPVPLLALVDPDLPGGRGTAAPGPRPVERLLLFASGVRLGPLPFARREGDSAVRQLGGESLLRAGRDASEGFLKSTALRRFGVLHFATHTVLDDLNPERSGVLLTAEPKSEDGLLQIREIVPLHLDGRVVVLSSCRSASGEVLRGEGVMGIARAFFQAGAHAVVASLWPLRDDDGAALFDRFYAHLAGGESIAAALRGAQRDRVGAGAPAYAWAGLMVLGDGDVIPLPGGRRGLDLPVMSGRLALAVTAATVLLVLGLALLRRSR